MTALLRDLRFAVRGLRGAPGYTLAFIVTLGLGIGADSAIFSVVNGVMLQPLPYRDGHELVYVRQSAPLAGMENALFSVPEIQEYRDNVDSFEGVAEFSSMDFTLHGLDEPRRIRAGVVTGNYFEVMGLEAALGRVITSEDDGRADPVMVLTHDYWHSTLGGSPDVIGRQLRMNGLAVTVVGVAEPAPPYPERTDMYVNMSASPHHLDATMQTDRAHRMTEVFARLAPDATIDEARREVEQVAAQAHAAFPQFYDDTAGYMTMATPLQQQLVARGRTVFLLLLGAAGLVLLIACANVANLTLARALRRRHELEIRASLGADRGILRRQLLVENLVPSLLGAGLGLVVAQLTLDALVQYAGRFTARAAEIGLDATVLGATLIAGIGAACLFAFVPRLPNSGAQGGGRATSGARGRHMQRALVVVQVAVCFVLLIGAGLMLRTLVNLERADSGMDLETVLSMRVPWAFGTGSAEDLRLFYESVVQEVGALPGVTAAAISTRLPLAGSPEGLDAVLATLELDIEGHEIVDGVPPPRADYRVVTPHYFEALGMHLVAGRLFTASDAADGAAPVVLINEAMARRYFPDRNPVGQRIQWTGELIRFIGVQPVWRTVVGVVSDTNDFGVDNPVPDVVFEPFPGFFPPEFLFVRTSQPAAVARLAVDTIHHIDPEQPVTGVATLAEVRADSIAPQRLNATLIGVFALLAVAIAAVGVAGVLAFSVSRRRRELGVRAALGADRRRLVTAVLTEGALMASGGLLIAWAIALLLSRLAAGLLFGVAPTDAGTFVAVASLLLAVALAAAWLPARRAARVDPVTALRAE